MNFGRPSSGERVAVLGLGYVGLPLAVALAKGQGNRGPVLGFDIDRGRIAELKAGKDRTEEIDAATLKAARIELTDDPAALVDQDVYIVTVPTPVDAENRPDLGPVESACRTIGKALAASNGRGADGKDGVPIVVLESTVYPGVTEDVCGPLIEQVSGRKSGEGFLLGYSPERINPGDRNRTVDKIAKIVSGQTPEAAAKLADLYGRVTSGGIHMARDIRTAEAAKVIENAQRDINIAFVNEVAMIFGRLGISVHDVLDAARTKWNFLDFRPGLVGGHCIGVDPFYLAHCAEALGHHAEVILAGRRINDAMGAHIADRIADALARYGEPRQPRTLVLGLTFKENMPDLRNTKVIDLVQRLKKRGHRVDVHDERADPAAALEEYGIELLADLPAGDGAGEPYDCLIGAVAHDRYRGFTAADFARLLRPGGLVADIKGMWRATVLPEGLGRWQL